MALYYFAYLSNMSPKRLHQSCPNAVRECAAKLPDHELVFIGYKEEWKGACGNVRPAKGNALWGVVWRIEENDLPGLQGTEKGANIEFSTVTCTVVSADGRALGCRSFWRACTESDLGLPSPQYLQVGIQGAERNGLPKEYVDMLKSTPTNNNTDITSGMAGALYTAEELQAFQE